MAPDALEHHLEWTVRGWLGIPDDAADVPELPRQLADLLLRTEERREPHRDAWGGWEGSYSESYHRGTLWVAEVDRWVTAQRRELADRVELEPLWPAGCRFAVCLTHDVDMMSRRATPAQAADGIKAALRRVPGEGARPLQRAVRFAQATARPAAFGVSRVPSAAETLERCVAVERDYGVTGSYFFTVSPPRPTPYDCTYRLEDPVEFRGRTGTVADVIRHLAEEGFDIGLHGSYLSAFDAELLALEKATLERALGHAVSTTRQHYLRYDVSVTPALHEQAGFCADSTLGFNRNVGFRAGTSMPFRLFDVRNQRTLDLLEVPLTAMDFALVRPNSLELDERLGMRVVRQLIDEVAEVGGVATLLFHPHALLDPTVLAIYRSSIEYGLKRGAWFASLADIDRWWRQREARLRRAWLRTPS